jgi:hypothetical protein
MLQKEFASKGNPFTFCHVRWIATYIFLYFPTLFPAIDQFIGDFPAISKDIKDSTKPSFVGSSLSNAAVSLAPHDWQLLSRPSK